MGMTSAARRVLRGRRRWGDVAAAAASRGTGWRSPFGRAESLPWISWAQFVADDFRASSKFLITQCDHFNPPNFMHRQQVFEDGSSRPVAAAIASWLGGDALLDASHAHGERTRMTNAVVDEVRIEE